MGERTNFDMVEQFHLTYDQEVKYTPEIPSEDIQKLRYDLIDEELSELAVALHAGDIVGVADALGDILYVTYGAGHAFGIDLNRVFAEIHRSNMSKLDADGKAIKNEMGKVMKSKSYSPPNLRPILFGDDPLPFFVSNTEV